MTVQNQMFSNFELIISEAFGRAHFFLQYYPNKSVLDGMRLHIRLHHLKRKWLILGEISKESYRRVAATVRSQVVSRSVFSTQG